MIRTTLQGGRGSINEAVVTSRGHVPVDYLDNFSVRVNNGEIPGYSNFFRVGYAPSLTTSFEDVWGAGGSMTLPTGPEAYEVVSSSVNDTAGGTGANAVLVQTLDAGGLIQNNVVVMNGTTPVAVAGLHSFPRIFLVTSSGSGMRNAGEITLRVSGGGATRDFMLAGYSNALSSQYKVPSNKRFHVIGLDYHSGGSSKIINVSSEFLLPGSNTWAVSSNLPIVEQSFAKEFIVSAPYEPGTCITYRAKVNSGSGDDFSVILQGFEVDL